MSAFSIAGARPLAHAVAPMIAVDLRAACSPGAPGAAGAVVHSAMLACQVAIEPSARAYDDPATRTRLAELFGAAAPPRALIWTHASVVVPGFTGETLVPLVLPCPLDFHHAAAKYFDAVRDGELPIVVQLSGTVFYPADDGRLQVAPIARDREARFRLPVAVWRETVRHYFPDLAPLALHRDTFDRLHDYRRAHGLATADDAIDALLERQPS